MGGHSFIPKLMYAVAVGCCGLCIAQPALNGRDAARSIDWNAVGIGAPIPDVMPAADSDDPVEAGFAPEWIDRAVVPSLQADQKGQELVREIVSSPRKETDHLAYEVDAKLREIIRTSLPAGKHARVFCNALGCLCYVERNGPFSQTSIVYHELAKAPMTQVEFVRWVLHPVDPEPWELTILQLRYDASSKSVEAK